MIISFGKGGSSASSAVEYMLAKKDHKDEDRERVDVLEGNPRLTAKIADNLDFKRTYSSGIIAWAVEEKPSDKEIIEVLTKFEKLAFSGMEKDQYSWSAVLHEEKNGSKHIHFLIADVELTTGNKFNPAPPGHRKAFDALRDSIIFDKGWADPADKSRSQLSQDGYLSHLPDNKNPKKAINNFLTNRVHEGLITNRSDVIKSLEEIGEITRQGDSYISVKPEGFKQALRLKGDLYERKFNTTTYVQAERKETARQRRGGEIDQQRASNATQQLQKSIKSRAEYNQQRYPKNPNESLENIPVNRLHDLSSHLREQLGGNAIPINKNNQSGPAGRGTRDYSKATESEHKWTEFEEVRGNGLIVRSNKRASRNLSGWVSASENKKVENPNDRTRELFNKISRDVTHRIRKAREGINSFISGFTDSKSNFNQSAEKNERAINNITEQQRHSSEISQAIADRVKKIEAKRWLDKKSI